MGSETTHTSEPSTNKVEGLLKMIPDLSLRLPHTRDYMCTHTHSNMHTHACTTHTRAVEKKRKTIRHHGSCWHMAGIPWTPTQEQKGLGDAFGKKIGMLVDFSGPIVDVYLSSSGAGG